ncbi:uncharacterized protein [Bactrocera oleae]|uniref:uncharacterized protein n=1 Tax=Bactrocera oleae TaxID=104688 RepID=UPI00387E79EE
MELILIFLFAAAIITPSVAVVEPNAEEVRIISECLRSYGGLTEENSQRLVRFKGWSETYEEIPCFTKCYIKNMFDMFDESVGFKDEQVIKQFGQPLYKACKHRMEPSANSCQQAYNGFHCLVNLEDDPFVLIESMKNVSIEAKTAMKDCLHRFDQYEWERVKDYSKNPVREPIPCFTKCFIDRLQLYSQQSRQWNIPALTAKLGVPATGANIQHCLKQRRKRNACVSSAATTKAAERDVDSDTEILRKCLREVGSKDLVGELQKVARYSEWTLEEVPCFTRCLASMKHWFDANESKWNKQQIADDLGADMFNYCRYELDRYNEDSCEFAYTGLRCLKQAELYTLETYKNIVSCASELNVTMKELQKYAAFPTKEVVPCLFQCLAEKLNFYTPSYEWNFDNWVKAFGPMRQDRTASNVCKVSAEQTKTRDKCEWMYEEYNCLERLNYNTDGSYPLESTTLSAVITSKTTETVEDKTKAS